MTSLVVALAALVVVGCGKALPPAPVRAGARTATAHPPVVGAFITYHARSRVFDIGNGRMARRIQVSEDGSDFATVSLRSLPSGVECLAGPQRDFAVTIGGRSYTTGSGSLRYVRHKTSSDRRGSQQLRMYLQPLHDDGASAPFELSVVYEVGKDAPSMQTWVEVENLGPAPVLVDYAATQLTTVTPDAAYVWRRGGRPASVKLPTTGPPEHGLVWLQASTAQHGPLIVGFASAAPGPLRHVTMGREGQVKVGTAGGGVWAHPGQTVALASAYVWVSVGPMIAQAAREWVASIELARRAVDVAAATDEISVAGHSLDAEWLATRDVNGIVCVPYAWQAAWDGADDDRARVTAAVKRVQDSGRRAGLLVPVAWLPENGGLAEDPALTLTTAVGEPFPISWHGGAGVVGALSSEYGELALRSLVALIDDLGLDAVLLDGPITSHIDSGGAGGGEWHAPWESWNGLLRLVSSLKRERPDVHIGVSAETYGQADGFDVALHPVAFLWRYGRQASYDGFWRDVERAPTTNGGSEPN